MNLLDEEQGHSVARREQMDDNEGNTACSCHDIAKGKIGPKCHPGRGKTIVVKKTLYYWNKYIRDSKKDSYVPV
jgi:hypothetical protein